MKERRNTQPAVVRCKLVLVGEVQCGKTAMLQVLAKDCYPETYVPTVFENYTACLELEDHRVELSLWDTSAPPPRLFSGWGGLPFDCSFLTLQSHFLPPPPTHTPEATGLVTKCGVGGREYIFIYKNKINKFLLPEQGQTEYLSLFKNSFYCRLCVSHSSPYYDNVRPLCYSDSDAVLLCFDISRPETLDSAAKKWKTEILDYCPSTRMLLIGCKTDLRTDFSTLMELSNQKQTPISHEQGSAVAKQLGAEAYLECSAFTSEKSVHSIFRTTSLACLNKLNPPVKSKSPTRSLSKRLLHLPSKSELISSTFKKERAKSCSVM
uniref:Rho family GTPase 1 n=1 Tax=Latimeria chalumnae TaxID=7897 RepID=H3BB76_LATCH